MTRSLRQACAQIIAIAIVTTLFCLSIRLAISLRAADEYDVAAVSQAAKLALAHSSDDYILVLSASLLLLGLSFLGSLMLNRVARFVAIAGSLLICAAAFISIETIHVFGSPLTFPLIVYSDFFGTVAGARLVSSWFPLYAVIGLPLALATTLATSAILARHLCRGTRFVRVIAALTMLAVGVAILRMAWVYAPAVSPVAQANALLAFARSLGTPRALMLDGNEDAEPTSVFVHSAVPAAARGASPQLRNVLIFVMESVGAKYLNPYGGRYVHTPHLNELASKGVLFANAYSHSPSSEAALVSLFTSRHPFIMFQPATKDAVAGSWPSLTSELKRHGYSTSVFHSADTRYADEDKFLSMQQVDTISDARVQRCNSPRLFDPADKIEAVNDRCTASSLLHWIEAHKNGNWFAVMWTFETHYPYFVTNVDSRPEISVEGVPRKMSGSFSRFLAGIHNTDQLLGTIVAHLRQERLLENTLIVILGDHGEAFQQHRTSGHGADIYEESIRVPLIFYSPSISYGRRVDRLVGLRDVAPTIFGLLGLAIHPGWEGKDAFADGDSAEEYFFSAWRGYKVGYRRGQMKYIWSVTSDLMEIYRLDTDPEERINLASSMREVAQAARRRLIYWVRHRNATVNAQ